jgi:hypothetical protein
MENFLKQIYKKAEWQNKAKQETNLEDLEYSEKIAKEKLEKIMSPGFRDFGIRYMNIEEYRNLIETGKLSGEFTLFNKYYNQEVVGDFSEFLENFKTGYRSYHSIRMTDWEEMSGLASLKTGDLITGVKIIRNEYSDKDAVERDRAIRQYLLRYIEKG